MKKKAKTIRKNAVIKKPQVFLSHNKNKKASGRKPISQNLADSLYLNIANDPAHSPGHRKINLKESARAEKRGPKNRMTRADKVQRTSATNRRIIS
jgi:hypothetical protein